MRNIIEMAKNKATGVWHTAKSTAGRVATGTTAMVISGAAMAQGGPDLSAITTEINQYKTAVVALVIAFAVVLWAIKAAGLAKPR